jgi:threonine dehydrogenase-like Zn-dependent dehydrogenase
MKALIVERRPLRFVAARIASTLGAGKGAGVGPVRLTEVAPPSRTRDGFVAVTPLLAGICGSDLATVDGRSSRYFEDIVSLPFVPGHEVVGVLEEATTDAHGHELPAGSRVVLQPVLGCEARGLPLCDWCQAGHVGRCANLDHGHLKPGLQTGFCADTGGGWSDGPLLAHRSQLFCVPAQLSDEDAVTVEPMACAIHAALRTRASADDVVAVIGAGTLGLGVVAAFTHLAATGHAVRPRQLLIGARYAIQRQIAHELGADVVVPPDQLAWAVRNATRSLVVGSPTGRAGQLAGGADVVVDCVGSAESIEQSLSLCRPGGRVLLVGMPGTVTLDLANLWHREVELTSAYAYGLEETLLGEVATFDLALKMADDLHTGRLVSAHYPIDRFEEALAHAGQAGARGSIKIVFDVGGKKAAARREA